METRAGSRIGPYQIVMEIGAGGMGTVYRAHDSRLGRDVAIKISAERFSERFEREARAVAALNHPNICTLHDVGPDYLVMELVEGETLAETLAQRSAGARGLPLDETLRFAKQIALALEAAHEKGIVHRDLKPGNIKIKADGTVKVLDFGLAKVDAVGPDGSSDARERNLTHSPTIAATQVGLILGTAAYMAPEQARGKPVDKRADIWAFGVVLYEMLTGRRAFDGEDASTILAAVIQTEPKWDGVPQQVRRLLQKCLEKDPRKRLRDIGDAWDLIDETDAAPKGRAVTGRQGWIAAVVMTIVAGVVLWAPWRSRSVSSDRPLVRLEVELGSNVSLPPLLTPTPSSVVISPDGTRLAYVASIAGGPPKLLTRRMDQATATELASTEGGVDPFFSADGQWIGFFNGSRLNKVSVEGGAVVPLIETGIFAGAHWIDNGDIFLGSGLTKGVVRAPADGGTATTIVDLAEGELFHGTPQLLPGGRAVLVSVYGTPPNVDRATIDVVSMVDRSRKTIARGGTSARYLPSGHLVYTNRSTMFAVGFDLDRFEARGSPVPILNDMAFDPAAGFGQFDVSRDGVMVYRGGSPRGRALSTIQWLDSSGKQNALLPKPAEHIGPLRLSPDGQRLAMVVKEGASQDVWIYDLQRDAMTRLTFGEAAFNSPAWSSDGRYVAIGSVGSGIFWTRADGGSRPQPLIASKTISFPISFSPDGKRLAYYEVVGTPQIWTVSIELAGGLKAGRPERYLSTPFADTYPVFSPDGRWLAYESNEAGRTEVYVRAYPAPALEQTGKWQISNSGGSSPRWSPNGREILYRSGDQVMSVDYVVKGDSFVPGKPRVWLATLRGAQSFDLAPDGRRLVMFTPTEGDGGPNQEHTVVFIQNFFDELRRRVPVGN